MSSSESLSPPEWGVVLAFISLLFVLTLVGLSSSSPEMPSKDLLVPSEVVVSIEGAVMHPGSYRLQKGASLGDLLVLSQPHPQANLKKMRKNRRLKDREHIFIPEKPLSMSEDRTNKTHRTYRTGEKL